MAYEILPHENSNYLTVRVTGNLTTELAAQLSIDAGREANNRGVERYLYDVRQSVNVESDVQNYLFAFEGLEKLIPNKTSRTAIVRRPDDISHDFVVLAARKVGYNIRVFTDCDNAIAWLEE